MYLLAKLAALTTTDGLPSNFAYVTREVHHYTELSASQLPACLLEMQDPEPTPKLSHAVECTLNGKIVVLFAPGTPLPATVANSYRQALEKAITADPHLGGRVDLISFGRTELGLWRETALMGMALEIRLLYEYTPTAAPLA